MGNIIDRDALLTAAEAAALLQDISRHAIGMWVVRGKLHPRGKRGRSPLYRWGDILDIERDTRMSPLSSRCRDRRQPLQPLAA